MGNCTCVIDLVGDGSERSIQAWLRYYATAEDRRCWALEFPQDRMPDPVDPPFDRDRHLPRC
jgi:hypothetical protein